MIIPPLPDAEAPRPADPAVEELLVAQDRAREIAGPSVVVLPEQEQELLLREANYNGEWSGVMGGYTSLRAEDLEALDVQTRPIRERLGLR